MMFMVQQMFLENRAAFFWGGTVVFLRLLDEIFLKEEEKRAWAYREMG